MDKEIEMTIELGKATVATKGVEPGQDFDSLNKPVQIARLDPA
jgi:hypothetical protein